MSPLVHVDLHVHYDGDLSSVLASIKQQGEEMAQTLAEVRAILASYKTATDQIATGLTEVAADVAALLAKAANPSADNLSDAEIATAQENVAKLQSLADALTKLGADTDPNAPATPTP